LVFHVCEEHSVSVCGAFCFGLTVVQEAKEYLCCKYLWWHMVYM